MKCLGGLSSPLSSCTLYAVWGQEGDVEEAYLVTYDYSYNGGESSNKIQEEKLPGEKIDLNVEARKTGYEFIGWSTNPNDKEGLDSLIMGNEDITLYAIFKKDISINFIDYKGAEENQKEERITIYNNDKGEITAPEINVLMIAVGVNAGYVGWIQDAVACQASGNRLPVQAIRIEQADTFGAGHPQIPVGMQAGHVGAAMQRESSLPAASSQVVSCQSVRCEYPQPVASVYETLHMARFLDSKSGQDIFQPTCLRVVAG